MSIIIRTCVPPEKHVVKSFEYRGVIHVDELSKVKGEVVRFTGSREGQSVPMFPSKFMRVSVSELRLPFLRGSNNVLLGFSGSG